MDGQEYRKELLAYAKQRGYFPPSRNAEDCIFSAPSGARVVVEFEPGITEKRGYLSHAKGRLTAAQNAALGILPRRRKPWLLLPSRILDEPWLHAFGRGFDPEEESSEGSGKWIMFITEQNVDDTWKNVSAAVREGRLADYAKISTRAARIGNRPYVLCVYVRDYRNRDEVMAVRERLRALGFKRKIPFKSDAMTDAGISGSLFSA